MNHKKELLRGPWVLLSSKSYSQYVWWSDAWARVPPRVVDAHLRSLGSNGLIAARRTIT